MGAAQAVEEDDDEAYQRQDKRDVHCRKAADGATVDDARLQWRKHRPAEDGHDEAGGAKLGVIAESFERDAIDGGEHQRHTRRDSHQTVEPRAVLQDDDTDRKQRGRRGENGKQTPGVDIAQQVGADKTAAAEDDHRYDVVAL